MSKPETNPALPRLQGAYRAQFERERGDAAGRFAAQDYLDHSTAIYHDAVIGLGFLPRIYDTPALLRLDSLATTTYGILEKVTRRFLADPAYRTLFGFSPTLERLICLPTGYESVVPIMRMDIFLDDGTLDFRFCEFNTDGASAMNEDREGANALCCSTTFAGARRELGLEPQELFEGWVDRFLAIYESSEQARAGGGHDPCSERADERADHEPRGERANGRADHEPRGEQAPVRPIPDPCIAIIDYTASATTYEFEEFRARFEQRGYRCLVCDIASLTYRDGALYGVDNEPSRFGTDAPQPIDAVYRRAVTGEILAELEALEELAEFEGSEGDEKTATGEGVAAGEPALTGARALIRAVEERSICMIGGFVTHVAHCKQLFTVLHLPETASFLTEEERAFIRRHVPYTTRLDNHHIDLSVVKAEKDRWIVKPEDGYASQGVHAGIDHSQSAWEGLIDTCSTKPYVVQHYCEQHAMPNTRVTPLDADGKRRFVTVEDWTSASPADVARLEPWNILTGLYLYDGRFSGVYVRAGQKGIIVGFAGGITIPSFLANYDPDAGLALKTRPVPNESKTD